MVYGTFSSGSDILSRWKGAAERTLVTVPRKELKNVPARARYKPGPLAKQRNASGENIPHFYYCLPFNGNLILHVRNRSHESRFSFERKLFFFFVFVYFFCCFFL